MSTKGLRRVVSVMGAGEAGDAAPLGGSCLLPARHRVRGFHFEEEGGAASPRPRLRLDEEAALGRLGGGKGPERTVSI